jgi:glycosyltransferase involved in cell wall biosynthesis
MLISIIIPCFNEINTLEKIVKKVLKQKNIKKKEIIIVDDGSNDGTQELIKKKIFKLVDKVIFHKNNKGKGAAIITGIKNTTGDIILIQDADLEYDPSDYHSLVNPIINKEALVVYGSRVLYKKRYQSKEFISIYRVFFNHLLTIISNVINNQNLTDAHTGYKVFSSSVVKKLNLNENDFAFCPEVNTKLANLSIKINEVPISYNGRSYKEGKKIGFKDGFRAIYVILKYKFFYIIKNKI